MYILKYGSFFYLSTYIDKFWRKILKISILNKISFNKLYKLDAQDFLNNLYLPVTDHRHAGKRGREEEEENLPLITSHHGNRGTRRRFWVSEKKSRLVTSRFQA